MQRRDNCSQQSMFNHFCLAVAICIMLAQSKTIHNMRPTCQVLSYCRILLYLHRDCTIWDDAVQTWKRLHSARASSGGHTWQFRYGGRFLVRPALIPSDIINSVAAWHSALHSADCDCLVFVLGAEACRRLDGRLLF
jgi:hypothetical protein